MRESENGEGKNGMLVLESGIRGHGFQARKRGGCKGVSNDRFPRGKNPIKPVEKGKWTDLGGSPKTSKKGTRNGDHQR